MFIICKTVERLEREEDNEQALSESGEDSSGSSDEDKQEYEDGEERKEDTWTMPGQVKRKVSERVLARVSENEPP